MSNIYLIGFRGCGKTTIGHILSKKILYNFKDMDLIIQEKYKKTIRDIVKNDGWDKFRKIESNILKKISKKNNQIVSTGGGIILNKSNCIIMQMTGIIFYLNVTEKTLKLRLKLDPKIDQRPKLVKSNIYEKKEMIKILLERKILYKKVAHKIINAEKSPNEIIKNILLLL